MENQQKSLYCDISGNDVRPYVPKQIRRQIFDNAHNLAHPGVRPTQKLINRRFVWPSIRNDISEWVKTCLTCQRNKIHRHVKTVPERIAIPGERFRHVHIDIIGPLPLRKGFRYCLTIIERFTRWPEAIPIADITAETIVDAFFSVWVSRFGAPAIITSDRGSQFESQLFRALTNVIGADKIRTTAYHPASNGMVERWHRSLKTAIMCHTDTDWVDVLPLLGLRTAVKDDVKSSAAELVYRTSLRLTGEFFVDITPTNQPRLFLEKLRLIMRKVRSVPAAHHIKRKSFVHDFLYTCSHVFVRVDAAKRPLESPYDGPYEVMERIDDKVFKIIIKGTPSTISIERLKPAFIEAEATDVALEMQNKFSNNSQGNLRTYPGPSKTVKFAS